jgi:hypothetical protein
MRCDLASFYDRKRALEEVPDEGTSLNWASVEEMVWSPRVCMVWCSSSGGDLKGDEEDHRNTASVFKDLWMSRICVPGHLPVFGLSKFRQEAAFEFGLHVGEATDLENLIELQAYRRTMFSSRREEVCRSAICERDGPDLENLGG